MQLWVDPVLRRDVTTNRSTVERVNGRLKDEFGGRSVRVRGHAKVLCHLMFGIVALTVDQIDALGDLKLVSRPRFLHPGTRCCPVRRGESCVRIARREPELGTAMAEFVAIGTTDGK